MNTPLPAQLRDLKLGGMAAALESQQEQIGTYEDLSFTERLALLVDQELLDLMLTHRASADWTVTGHS